MLALIYWIACSNLIKYVNKKRNLKTSTAQDQMYEVALAEVQSKRSLNAQSMATQHKR